MRHMALMAAAMSGMGGSPLLCSMATDAERDAQAAGSGKTGDRTVTEAKTGTQSGSNPEPALSNSGLDTQGRFRVGEKISLGVRGGDIVLQQAGSGREVVVSETDLQGYLLDQFFTDKV